MVKNKKNFGIKFLLFCFVWLLPTLLFIFTHIYWFFEQEPTNKKINVKRKSKFPIFLYLFLFY